MEVTTIESPIRTGLRTLSNTVSAWLPRLAAAIIVLIIAHMIARIIAGIIRRALQTAHLDEYVHNSNMGGAMIQRAIPNPSSLLSKIAYWLVFLFGLSVVISILGIPALNTIVNGIYSYVPRIIAAIAIFLVAGGISAAISGMVARLMGDTATGKIVATVAPVIVMGIASFMILDQLKIAPAIVTITYAALMSSVFLGLALAFGIGGRDVASEILRNVYNASKGKKVAVQRDMQTGRARARGEAQNLRRRATGQ